VLSKQHRVVTWDLRGHGRTGATTATIEDAGHLPNIEQPAAFNGHLLDFLTAL
jgi:pimeloyl-ACP methyl ester carboxylesterase